MEFVRFLIDLFLHLDKHLGELIGQYGTWTYAILFTTIFAETGLVFTPFLPGDSLIFAAGTLARGGSLDVGLLFLLMCVAAVVGDTVNYWIGSYLGHRIIASKWGIRHQKYFDRTHAFYEKYGGKTIIIARFVPIVRTIAPFVAGLGSMTYRAFFAYNVIGGILWVVICLGAGYCFGGLPFVREHFSVVILAIIAISVMPGVIAYLRARAEAKRAAKKPAE